MSYFNLTALNVQKIDKIINFKVRILIMTDFLKRKKTTKSYRNENKNVWVSCTLHKTS